MKAQGGKCGSSRVEEEKDPSGGKGTKIQKAAAYWRVLALVPKIRFHCCRLPNSGLFVVFSVEFSAQRSDSTAMILEQAGHKYDLIY